MKTAQDQLDRTGMIVNRCCFHDKGTWDPGPGAWGGVFEISISKTVSKWQRAA